MKFLHRLPPATDRSVAGSHIVMAAGSRQAPWLAWGRTLYLVLIFAGPLVCNQVFAQPQIGQSQESAAESVLEQLLLGFDTLGATILQLITESDGGVLEESDILMRLKRPGGFYWETIAPFPELIVTDGKTLWNYQPDLEQVVIEDWNGEDSELAAQLLSGNTTGLRTDYEVVQLASGKEQQHFRLTPLAVDSVYKTITIGFERGIIQSIHVASKNGQLTAWDFISVQHNPQLEDSLFRFTPPVGIEIIDNRIIGTNKADNRQTVR